MFHPCSVADMLCEIELRSISLFCWMRDANEIVVLKYCGNVSNWVVLNKLCRRERAVIFVVFFGVSYLFGFADSLFYYIR